MPKNSGKIANPKHPLSVFQAIPILYAATGIKAVAVVKLAVAEKHMGEFLRPDQAYQTLGYTRAQWKFFEKNCRQVTGVSALALPILAS